MYVDIVNGSKTQFVQNTQYYSPNFSNFYDDMEVCYYIVCMYVVSIFSQDAYIST